VIMLLTSKGLVKCQGTDVDHSQVRNIRKGKLIIIGTGCHNFNKMSAGINIYNRSALKRKIAIFRSSSQKNTV